LWPQGGSCSLLDARALIFFLSPFVTCSDGALTSTLFPLSFKVALSFLLPTSPTLKYPCLSFDRVSFFFPFSCLLCDALDQFK